MRKVALVVGAVLGSVLFNCADTAAQKPQTAPSKSTTVSAKGKMTGFAFLITKGGDLKPARLAHVTLLYGGTKGQIMAGHVSAEYMTQIGLMMKNEMPTKDLASLSEEDACLVRLNELRSMLESTMQWAVEQGKSDQVKITDADEEGHFTINDLPVGFYLVIVSGRAGMNSAYWQGGISADVEVKAGKTTPVKLSSPEQACLQQ